VSNIASLKPGQGRRKLATTHQKRCGVKPTGNRSNGKPKTYGEPVEWHLESATLAALDARLAQIGGASC